MKKYISILCIGLVIGIVGGIFLYTKFSHFNFKGISIEKKSASESKVSSNNNTNSSATKPTNSSTSVSPTPSTGQTPVQQHGQLKVSGNKIVDKNGTPFQLRGMSTHGIQWYGDFVNKSSFTTLRDDWNVNCIRIAMYTDDNSGYQTKKDELKKIVNNGIQNCIDLGLYVIVDWHILSDGNPNAHRDEAIIFFRELATQYKNNPNVLYEICNEPNGNVSWNNDIKPYCEQVIREIRTEDKNAIVIAGTPTWSQQIDDAANNRLSDNNVVYALHFYANTHKDALRNTLSTCVKDKNLPVLVSEFGTCDASGNGGLNLDETKIWLKLLDANKIGYINWSLSSKAETASCFKDGTSSQGNWKVSDLTDGGKFIRDWYRAEK